MQNLTVDLRYQHEGGDYWPFVNPARDQMMPVVQIMPSTEKYCVGVGYLRYWVDHWRLWSGGGPQVVVSSGLGDDDIPAVLQGRTDLNVYTHDGRAYLGFWTRNIGSYPGPVSLPPLPLTEQGEADRGPWIMSQWVDGCLLRIVEKHPDCELFGCPMFKVGLPGLTKQPECLMGLGRSGLTAIMSSAGELRNRAIWDRFNALLGRLRSNLKVDLGDIGLGDEKE